MQPRERLANPVYPDAMNTRRSMLIPLLIVTLLVGSAAGASAQVATLRSPEPAAAASVEPAADVDGEEAILEFVACLRENGLEIPDPQFGPQGPRFVDPAVIAGIDFMSSDVLDAVEACGDLLAALQPQIDLEQQAEQNERYLAFAECMRRQGIDFPDPDPLRGFTISSLRGPDGELRIDPFSSGFLTASAVCSAEVGLELPGGPAGPS